MATEQIPTTLIADDAVTNAKIGADAVSTTEIANDASISTSGNIATTGSGTLTVAGTSTLTGALTASGGIANAGTISAGNIGSAVTGTFTEITSGSFTSSGQGPDFGNSHDYDIIEVYLTGLRSASDINYTYYRLAVNGSLMSGGNSYHWNFIQTVTSGTSNTNYRWHSYDSTQVLLAINAGQDAVESINAKITLWNAKETTYWGQYHHYATVLNSSRTTNTYHGGGMMNNVTGRITGLKLGSDFQAGKFIAFGAKI